MGAMRCITHKVEEMDVLAAEMVDQLIAARVILLHGDLGAGKTTFVQGVAKALGVTRPVKSPTYTLVNVHQVNHAVIANLVHVDLYRIARVDANEMRQIGLDELLADPKNLVMIEWPERLDTPLSGLDLYLSQDGDTHVLETKTAP